MDLDGDGAADTCADAVGEHSPYNAARPTVHNRGCNVTLLDGHVERIALESLWRLSDSGNPQHPYCYLDD